MTRAAFDMDAALQEIADLRESVRLANQIADQSSTITQLGRWLRRIKCAVIGHHPDKADIFNVKFLHQFPSYRWCVRCRQFCSATPEDWPQ